MDFSTIQGHVSRYLLDAVASTDAEIGTFINRAIRMAEDRYNFRHMERTQAYTTTEGQRLLGVRPATWKEARGLPYLIDDDDGSQYEIQWAPSESEMIRGYVDESAPATDRGDPDFLLEKYNSGATAGQENEIHVYPVPDGESDYDDGDYRIYVPYWAYSADLAEDADSNWITANMEWYTIYRATAEGFLSNRDEGRAQIYAALAEPEYRRIVKQQKSAKIPERRELSVRTGVYGPARYPRRITHGRLG